MSDDGRGDTSNIIAYAFASEKVLYNTDGTSQRDQLFCQSGFQKKHQEVLRH